MVSVEKIKSPSTDTIKFLINQKPESTAKKRIESSAAGAHYKFIENAMKEKLSNSTIQNAVKDIVKNVDYLESHNVKIVFYEMPISKSLRSLEKPEQIRQAFFKAFPPNQYEYINAKEDFEVISNDGIHLTGSSISDYSSFFKDKALILAK